MSAMSVPCKVAGAAALTMALVAGAGAGAPWAAAAEESPSPSASLGTAETTNQQTPLEKVNALVQPSVVFLFQTWSGYVYDKFNKSYLNNGQPFELQTQCTGFVINPDGYIASAGHCVDPKEMLGSFIQTAAQWAVANGYYSNAFLTVEDVVGFNNYRVESTERRNSADLDVQVGWPATVSGIDTSEVKRARVIDFNNFRRGDVALLKMEQTGLNALPLADDEVEVGADVVSIGFPGSVDRVTDVNLTPSFKEGSISSVKTVQGGVLPVYEISAAVSGGMSGGPSVNLAGEVIGVNSFGIVGEPQAFNFVRPASQLGELLAGSGVANEVSDVTVAYRDGLAAYWSGDKATAVERLGLVVDEQPANKLAQDYLDRAEALPDPPPPAVEDESGSGTMIAVAVGLGVLVLVGLGVLLLLLLRRRRTSGAGTPGAPPVPAPVGGPLPAGPLAPAAPGASIVAIPMAAQAAPTQPIQATPPPQPAPASSIGFAPPASAEALADSAPADSAAADPVPADRSPAEPTTPVPAPATAEEEDVPNFCGDCGDRVEPGKRFCSNCGSRLS